MKVSELRKLIREEVRKVLKEAENATLSTLQVGDQFTLVQDAITAPRMGSFFAKIPASQYSSVVFTVLEVTPKSVVCVDGKFQGGSISSPVDLTRQLPQKFYSDAARAQKKLKPVPGTVYWPDVTKDNSLNSSDYKLNKEDDVWVNTITFKPEKADAQVKKVGKLSA